MALGLSLLLLMIWAAAHHLLPRFLTFVACLLYSILLSREIWWLVIKEESFFLITLNLGFYGYIICYLSQRRNEAMDRVLWRNLLLKGIVASLLLTVPAQVYLQSYGFGNALLLLLSNCDHLIPNLHYRLQEEKRELENKIRMTALTQ